ncbi:MAG: flagellar biosynthetic protein FliO [Pirellula sp.]
MQSNSALYQILLSVFVTLSFASCYGTALGQFNSDPKRAGGMTNEPTVVRPQGHSLQTNGNGNGNPASRMPSNSFQPRAQDSQAAPAPETFSVQPSGQRVFNQNIQPSQSDTSRFNTSTNPNQNAPDAMVQPASWTTEPVSLKKDAGKIVEPIELKPSSKEALNSISKPKSSWATALSMMFSLAIVLCLFFIIAWLFRRTQPNSMAKLPSEVVQVMGRTAMAPRQQVYVLRFGSKMLLVSHQPGQTQTLGEITDPEEVQRLAGLCEANQPNSISHSFRDVLRQVASGRSDVEPRTSSRRRSNLKEA